MKKIFYISLLFLNIMLLGCSASRREVADSPALKPITFDFVPPIEGMIKSNDIVFGLLNPVYEESFKNSNSDPYKTFAANMGNDFVEMLTARGYPYKGPFLNYDQMVYSDKKEVDLTIQPEIALQFTGDYLKERKYFNVLRTSWLYEYYYDGNVTLTGKLNLIFSEPFTKTKIWVKSVQIDPVEFKLKSYNSYDSPDIPLTDPYVWNTLVENLSSIYNKTLSTAWNHLEPEELSQKKEEAAEIKKNSGFIKN
ncbi:MAG: hypothetical protein JST15_14365 [Bacteroidetes bacterium]|nr:hypothetical protein [Bacteroidota bacterium]